MHRQWLGSAFIAVSMMLAAPAPAQTPDTATQLVDAIGFARDYESHVDWVVEEMAGFGLIGTTGMSAKDMAKLRGEVRQYLLDEQEQVTSLLILGLNERRSEDELQGAMDVLAGGKDMSTLPAHVENSLRTEIYSAASAYALVVAMGNVVRRPTY